ncbi:MAG: type 1 glutamine amidotransferase [Gammaproteobacteria bacterium]
MTSALKFLILDAYDRAGREELTAELVTPAGTLYQHMLQRWLPQAHGVVAYPADADCVIPDGLPSYDAMLWTGSSLTIYEDQPEVHRQIDLVRQGFALGIPAFGSCWALQLAAVAAGGACRKNPNGREFGLARKISLTDAGRNHPAFAGRNLCFDGFTSHFDEVSAMPEHATVLAGSAMTGIQAAEIHYDKGSFLALQYHPEFDFAVVSGLARCRAEGLIAEGHFADRASVEGYAQQCEKLHRCPDDPAARFALAADDDVLNAAVRQNEFANWLRCTFTLY